MKNCGCNGNQMKIFKNLLIIRPRIFMYDMQHCQNTSNYDAMVKTGPVLWGTDFVYRYRRKSLKILCHTVRPRAFIFGRWHCFLVLYQNISSYHARFKIGLMLWGTQFYIVMLKENINPFPNKPWFLRVCSTTPLKTLWVTSNFSFSHSVFYPF